MEELKLLIEAVAEMPSLAIWVVAMYFFFKLAIVGSVFGVITTAIMKLHDWAKTKKESKVVTIETTRDIIEVKEVKFGKYCITDVEEPLFQLINEMVQSCRSDNDYAYIHRSNIKPLQKFWDEYKKRDNV